MAVSLNGAERLRLLHSIFHMDDQEPFRFSWDWLVPSGLSVKDFIAPSSFEFKNGKHVPYGGIRAGAGQLFFKSSRRRLNDRILKDFLDMGGPVSSSRCTFQSVDQVRAIKDY